MRTTLTLDEDLARLLKEKARRGDGSFKQVVNETLRAGLAAEEGSAERRPYRVEPVHLGGVRPGVDLHHALRLADALEDEALRRKLDERR